MTALLDIAALAALLLTVTFVPALWLRADLKITRQIRDADRAFEDQPAHSGARHNI